MYYANKTHFVIKIDKTKIQAKVLSNQIKFILILKTKMLSIFFGKYLKKSGHSAYTFKPQKRDAQKRDLFKKKGHQVINKNKSHLDHIHF